MILPPGEPAAGPWRAEPVRRLLDRLRAAAAVPGSVVVHTDDVAWHHSFLPTTEVVVA